MHDLAERFATNPLLSPRDVAPSRPGLSVICVLNPGAFTYAGKTWLVLRVAEGLRDHVKALVRANQFSWDQGHAETTF